MNIRAIEVPQQTARTIFPEKICAMLRDKRAIVLAGEENGEEKYYGLFVEDDQYQDRITLLWLNGVLEESRIFEMTDLFLEEAKKLFFEKGYLEVAVLVVCEKEETEAYRDYFIAHGFHYMSKPETVLAYSFANLMESDAIETAFRKYIEKGKLETPLETALVANLIEAKGESTEDTHGCLLASDEEVKGIIEFLGEPETSNVVVRYVCKKEG